MYNTLTSLYCSKCSLRNPIQSLIFWNAIFNDIQILCLGFLWLYRQAAKPGPIWYLHWIVRSLSSRYLELFFASTMQSRTKRLLISRLIFLSLGQWSNYDRKFWSVYIFLTYTHHELLTYSDNIYLFHWFVYISRPRVNTLVYKPRLSMRAISIIWTLILFFFVLVDALHLSILSW